MKSEKTVLLVLVCGVIVLTLVSYYIEQPRRELGREDFVLNESSENHSKYKWDHMPLSYSVSEECSGDFERDILGALDFISNRTDGAVRFVRTKNETPDITYYCGGEDPNRLYGEAHPFYLTEWLSFAPSYINYYRLDNCERPIVMIHETLHLLGLDHGTNRSRSDIMRSRFRTNENDCNRDISKEDIGFLKGIYGNI